uniref:Uncharacterized protein n=1 Tax=Candidatus Kentrum sp. MB TaxID=2138164 RepID=A0A450XG44_9GAMM|nr:MAG: hypothetical protein BECKMB1821G_GA0114241_103518 [Candidatus Kentron sp. MB]
MKRQASTFRDCCRSSVVAFVLSSDDTEATRRLVQIHHTNRSNPIHTTPWVSRRGLSPWTRSRASPYNLAVFLSFCEKGVHLLFVGRVEIPEQGQFFSSLYPVDIVWVGQWLLPIFS